MSHLDAQWSTHRLRDIADIKTGPFGSALHQSEYRQLGTPIVTVEHLGERGLIHRQLPLVGDDDAERLATYRCLEGDILFSRVGSIDRSSLVAGSEEGWLFSGRLLRVRVDRKRVHAPFLRYQFSTEHFKRRVRAVAVGQTMPSLNTQILGSIQIRLPGLVGQRTIARRLADADDLIAALERMIAKKQAIKQGMMQQLITGKTRLPGFTKPWSEGTFEQLAGPSRERAMPRDVPPSVPLVELSQLEGGSGRLLGTSKAAEAVSLKAVFKSGDVLFGKLRAYLRKYWYADVEGLCTTEIWVLRARTGVHGRFVRYIVETQEFIDVASGAYGTHMPRSDWGTVKNLPVGIPPFAEQVAIAATLADVDREVSLLHERLVKARHVQEGMMQELLTGRTRLPVKEGAA